MNSKLDLMWCVRDNLEKLFSTGYKSTSLKILDDYSDQSLPMSDEDRDYIKQKHQEARELALHEGGGFVRAPGLGGLGDMAKMMKYMIYFSPLLMLIFFNNYASGLSLYYFISNLITIGIMIVIKNYILDEDKIHAQIQENKKKPKKQSRFQKKMAEMMEQAEQQKRAQQNRKK